MNRYKCDSIETLIENLHEYMGPALSWVRADGVVVEGCPRWERHELVGENVWNVTRTPLIRATLGGVAAVREYVPSDRADIEAMIAEVIAEVREMVGMPPILIAIRKESAEIVRAERVADEVRERRAELMRQARTAGIMPTEIGAAAGMTRAAIYKILDRSPRQR